MKINAISIKVKFTIIAVSISLISFGIAAFLSNQWMAKVFQRHYEEEAMLLRTHIIHDLESAMLSEAHGGIPEVLNIYRAYKGVEEVRVFDLKGREVFFEGKGSNETRIEEMRRTGKTIHFDKEINGEKVASYVIPISNNVECHGCHGKSEAVRGGLLLSLSLKEMEQDIALHKRRFSLLFALIAMAISVATILTVSRLLLKPLGSIQKGAEVIGRGDFGYQIPFPSNDEIGELARTFNQMSRQLKEFFEFLRRSQERIIQAEKLSSLGHLSAGLAHELKNPLTSIKMILQTILDGSSNSEITKEDIGVILKEVKKLDSILTQFLIFARPPRLHLQPLSLNHTVEEVLSLLKPELDRCGIEVFKEISPDLPQIRGDHEKIRQVLINLLLNSIQAMPEGGRLRIGAREIDDNHERGVALWVEDTGTGIPEEVREKVFDPFFTTKKEGTGLGLSFVYSIIKEHHGRIDIQSQVGKGTAFTITFLQEKLKREENEENLDCR